jgi:predicted PhzF superfamily epimerase YddE/YHI9
VNLPFFWVDAFTDHAFGGNPAAIMPLDAWPEDGLLQRIANENGLSETAYFVRTGPARADLRWFTPTIEVDLCGHATLAAAFVLFEELGQLESPMVFDTKSGPLSAKRLGSMVELDFPERAARPAQPTEALLRGLARPPTHVLRSERMWLCVYETEADVVGLQPDHAALAGAVPGRIIVTAPGAACDFVSRFFAPDVGIPEDPVTGSAHCTLVPYWAERLGKTRLHARQVSRRGGELWCELDGPRVRMAGKGALYLKGQIRL